MPTTIHGHRLTAAEVRQANRDWYGPWPEAEEEPVEWCDECGETTDGCTCTREADND